MGTGAVSFGCVVTLVGAACVAAPARAQDKAGPLLLLSQAECLRENADDYIAQIDGTGLVFIGFCDDLNPTRQKIAEATSQNSYGESVVRFEESEMRTIPGLDKFPVNERAVVLVLSEDQVACVRDRFDTVVEDLDLEVVRLADNAADSVARLDFDACR